MSIRCIAIDDEPFALGIITEYCSRVPFLQLEKSFTSGIEAINYLSNSRTDLIFLDIEMRDISGLQFLDIVSPRPSVILTTAYEQYALTGFDYGVLDYLLKPIPFDRFLKAVTKASKTNIPQDTLQTPNQSEKDFLFAKSGYSNVKINYSDIYYIEGQRDYQLIYTTKEKIMTLQTMRYFEETLPKKYFLRVHKSYIINTGYITRTEKNMVWLNQTHLPVSENYKKELQKAIDISGQSAI